jgi:hypothetical protein
MVSPFDMLISSSKFDLILLFITRPLYGFGYIHVTIPVLFLAFQGKIYQKLGQRWLHFRENPAERFGPEHGALEQVEAAIAAAQYVEDLNELIQPKLRLGVHDLREDAFTLLTLACFNGHVDSVDRLLAIDGVNIDQPSRYDQWTPIHAASLQGHKYIVEALISVGADVNQTTRSGETALLLAATCGRIDVIRLLADAGAQQDDTWMNLSVEEAAQATLTAQGRMSSHPRVLLTLRAYVCGFTGRISAEEGCKCVASWPGIYAKEWDRLVQQAKNDDISAAVVFLPGIVVLYGLI